MDTEYFIECAKKVHGSKYDYSKVDYVDSVTKVCIICPEHGEFWQRPANHLQGAECPKCSGHYMDTEFFVECAKKVHGSKYDYSKVDYVDSETKVCIICPEHGEFWQKPSNHLQGAGCPVCNASRLESTISKTLEKNNIRYVSQKRFDWLKNVKPMPLDFYLPEYNIAIECQGGQHFFPVKHFGGEKHFKVTCELDDLKNKLCKEHGIKILYFADDEDYIEGYRYDVITDIDELLAEIKKAKTA